MDIKAFVEDIRARLRLPQSPGKQSSSNISQGEKIAVFSISFIVAIALWLLINLGKDFTVSLQLPVEYGSFPEDMAPSEPLPATVEASLTGEGWQLLNLYSTPPGISVDARSSGDIRVQEAVQTQLSSSQNLTLNGTQPETISVSMEEALQKNVPVVPQLELDFAPQFNRIGPLVLEPDSVQISGARSLVEPVSAWRTNEGQLEDLEDDFSISLSLQPADELLSLSHSEIRISGNVEEFTEGRAQVPVEIQGVPNRQDIVLSPPAVDIRYNVPVSQYQQSREAQLFRAVVSYAELEADNTGYIEPRILVDDSRLAVSLRGVQPPRLSYFMVVD